MAQPPTARARARAGGIGSEQGRLRQTTGLRDAEGRPTSVDAQRLELVQCLELRAAGGDDHRHCCPARDGRSRGCCPRLARQTNTRTSSSSSATSSSSSGAAAETSSSCGLQVRGRAAGCKLERHLTADRDAQNAPPLPEVRSHCGDRLPDGKAYSADPPTSASWMPSRTTTDYLGAHRLSWT